MEDHNQHLEDLNEIRSIMERSTKFLSLSGLSGVFAGIFAIIGTIPAIKYFGFGLSASKFYAYSHYPDRGLNYYFLMWFFGIAISVLVLAIATAVFLTIRKAKKNNQPYFDSSARRLLYNLFIPLITGGIFCLMLANKGYGDLLLPSTLIFYGIALFNAGKYTLNDIRYLGLCEILLGLLSTFFLRYGILFWVTGFGLLHIVYGTWMYFKYER
jgi:hypothetical protein